MGLMGGSHTNDLIADIRKVVILPQTDFWGFVYDHLKNIRYLLIVLIIT